MGKLFSKYISINKPGFILAGQSNISGIRPLSELEVGLQTVFPRVKFYKHTTAMTTTFMSMSFFDPTSFRAPDQGDFFALQFYLYPDLATQINKTVYIVHHASNGTSLTADWRSTSPRGALYVNLVYKTRAAKRLTTGLEFRLFIWGQGEQDATNATWAGDYQTNLTNFINNFRSETGLTNLPFFIMRLNVNASPGSYPHKATVIAAQEAVAAALSNVYIITQDNAEMHADLVHYTAAGYRTLANNILIKARELNLLLP